MTKPGNTRSPYWIWGGAVLALALLICLVAYYSWPSPPGPPPIADPGKTPDAVPFDPTPLVQTEQAVPGPLEKTVTLRKGDTVSIGCRVVKPSQLPANARLRMRWRLVEPDDVSEAELWPPAPTMQVAGQEPQQPDVRDDEALGIYTTPTFDWSKSLHALDSDVYVVYRAPVSGKYMLDVRPDEDEVRLFAGERWRESGKVAQSHAVPTSVDWPADAQVSVQAEVLPIDLSLADSGLSAGRFLVEAEPNDTPEQAVPIAVPFDKTNDGVVIVGGADDIEYFDNGRVGQSGDDWYRLDFQGDQPKLLKACLSIPDQQVAARVRCYVVPAGLAEVVPGKLLPLRKEYTAGKNTNERAHQQTEAHRIAINRTLRPRNVYFLRVEANAPGYELQVRVVDPAPYDDPHLAIQHALDDHIGQVDSWLVNRPRAISVERRIRDTGNLLGSGCMSCHAQAGVWGPAIPLAHGYRPRNVQLMRNLVNISYQSMRPTNELIDAANNASLAPLDLGDGPAGTRVAGHAVVAFERFRPPRALHAKQAIRAANNVLQTSDPSAVNAAGPGANVGAGVVLNYAGEVVEAAWRASGDPKYFRALEDKARRLLELKPKFTDDVCHRVEFLARYFPKDYLNQADQVRVAEMDETTTSRVPYESIATTSEQAQSLWKQVQDQIKLDVERLRAIQNDDGSWGFKPGKSNEPSSDNASKWRMPGENPGEPSPTALALIALEASGATTDDPAVKRGVKALLQMQKKTGYWKGSSLTGFVSTAYALNALARLYPAPSSHDSEQAPEPGDAESLIQTIHRVWDLSIHENPNLRPQLLVAAEHPSPWVRYWAMIGLGTVPDDACVQPLVRGLGDKTKMVREAAHWGLRQVLIDDRGWSEVLAAAQSEDDHTREAAMRALLMRVDGVLPRTQLDWSKLTATLDRGMNDDSHPAVRAWAMRAAWNWWYWNPPVRQSLNQAWQRLLTRTESDALVENSIRYQSHALFVVNGHHANESNKHQYQELGELFAALQTTLNSPDPATSSQRARLARRLVGVSATFYASAGGDGGPGQMGYVTPNADKLFGDAFLAEFARWEKANAGAEPISPSGVTELQVVLEGAANIPHQDLQQKLIHYSLNGPEHLRTIAATSVSDPRTAQLVAVPEMIEPLVRQVYRGAMDPPRRSQLSDPILRLFGRVRWMVPTNREQQDEILGYLIPKLDGYRTEEQIKAITDPAERQAAERKLSADQYLAAELGDVFGSNPDLQFDAVIERFPEKMTSPLEARFWLPSVTWILSKHRPLPEVGGEPPALQDDPWAAPRQRALDLYLSQLSQDAAAETRELALNMAQATVLRSHPKVIEAVKAILDFEENPLLQRVAKNVLRSQEDLERQLVLAIKREEPARVAVDADGNVVLSPEFLRDFAFFRDYVTPEMNRPQRADQRSCFSCHGVPDRVPSLTLERPNKVGYLAVSKLLTNYRLLQDRINHEQADRSKLLRKPLNVQSGDEDGHQGGLRYRPTDPGYQILRRWVEHQSQQRGKLGAVPVDARDSEARTAQENKE